jgi:hypothetical protein
MIGWVSQLRDIEAPSGSLTEQQARKSDGRPYQRATESEASLQPIGPSGRYDGYQNAVGKMEPVNPRGRVKKACP